MRWVWVVAAVVLLSACARATAPGATAAGTPAPATSTVARALAATGIEVKGRLDAPAGFHGYLGNYQGRVMPVYVTPDGQHVLVGSVFDLKGQDLTSPAMQQAIAHEGDAVWSKLAATPTAIVAGDPHAKRIVYAFMDTDCPYCHQFWQASQSWLAAGGVQMRIVLVAVIAPDSVPRGGAILDAADPAAAWAANERDFGPKRPKVTTQPSPQALHTLGANNQLMSSLGFQGTPTIVYRDAAGQVHVLQGMPQTPDELRAVFKG